MGTSQGTMDSPASTLSWQQDRILHNDYELIGRAWVIVLEASQGAALPSAAVANSLGVRLEFYGTGQKGQSLMPRIAQTKDRSTLLLLDPIVRADGRVGLPDIPDPAWVPPIPTAAQVTGDYVPPAAPMIKQELGDRARGQLKGTRFLVFGPVAQILIRPEGLAEGWIAQCAGAPGTGTQMELLIDQDTGQAFFFGGRYRIDRAG
ncbi:MAG: hypothetical protein LAO20_14325 [Acidobacteriia bacterium]|nr:hypothetical protein [Terriglobia bacterium]